MLTSGLVFLAGFVVGGLCGVFSAAMASSAGAEIPAIDPRAADRL